jgi:nitrate/nitrite transporter NarK
MEKAVNDAGMTPRRSAMWLVLLAAAGTFALTMGTRQTMGLFLSRRRGLAIGIVNAGGSFGQFVMAPIAAALMTGIGWASALQVMGLLVLLCLPAALLLKGNSQQAAPAGQQVVGTRQAIREALRNPSYLMLGAGFLVCGFHGAFLATHLPGVIASCGLPTQWAA